MPLYRFQLAIFAAISLVFVVDAVDSKIYSHLGSEIACAVGSMLLAMVDVSRFPGVFCFIFPRD